LASGDTVDVAAVNSNVGQVMVAQLGKFVYGSLISPPIPNELDDW
jgi:hypothetical protein